MKVRPRVGRLAVGDDQPRGTLAQRAEEAPGVARRRGALGRPTDVREVAGHGDRPASCPSESRLRGRHGQDLQVRRHVREGRGRSIGELWRGCRRRGEAGRDGEPRGFGDRRLRSGAGQPRPDGDDQEQRRHRQADDAQRAPDRATGVGGGRLDDHPGRGMAAPAGVRGARAGPDHGEVAVREQHPADATVSTRFDRSVEHPHVPDRLAGGPGGGEGGRVRVQAGDPIRPGEDGREWQLRVAEDHAEGAGALGAGLERIRDQRRQAHPPAVRPGKALDDEHVTAVGRLARASGKRRPEPADHHYAGAAATGLLLRRQGRLRQPDSCRDGEVEMGRDRPGKGAHGCPPPLGEDRAALAPGGKHAAGLLGTGDVRRGLHAEEPADGHDCAGRIACACRQRLLHRPHGQAPERDRGLGVVRVGQEHGAWGRGRGREGRGVGRVGDPRRGWRRLLRPRSQQARAHHGAKQHDRQDEADHAHGASNRRPRAGGHRLDDHRVPLPTSDATRRMHRARADCGSVRGGQAGPDASSRSLVRMRSMSASVVR